MSTFNFTLFGAKGIFANNAIVLNNYCRKVFKPLLGYFAILSLIFSTNQSFSQINILDEDISDWVTALNDASNPAKSFSHDANNTNDTQFTQGSQDPDFISEWGWELGNTNNKGDISNAGAVLIGNTLYFFGDRTAINGDAAIGFWFFQSRVTRNPDGTFNGSHTVGDILVLSNFTNGGGRVDLRVYEWVGSGGSDGTLNFLRETTNARVNSTTTVIPDNGPFDASRNGGLIGGDMWTYQGNNVPSEGTPAPNTYHIGAFFEGFVRLSELSDRCFTTFLLETRNSQSLNASLQDFVMDEFGGVPEAPLTSPVVYCVGDTASQLSATGTNLLWYSSLDDTTGETTAPTPNTANAGTFDFYVSQSNDNGCESERALIRVTVNALPVVDAQDNAVCTGSTVQLSATPTGGTWSGANVNAEGLFNAAGLAAGPYDVTYTYTDGNLCTADDGAVVTVNALPVVDAQDNAVCTGSTVQLSATPTGGTWSGANVNAEGLFNAAGLAAGPYDVTYTYTDGNLCTADDGAVVTVNALPVVDAQDNAVCTGSTVQLSATPTGGTWSGANVNAEGLFNAAGLAAGPYDVTYTYTDGNLCTADDGAVVTVNALPVVDAQDNAVCTGSTVQLSATPTGGTWSGANVNAEGLFNAAGLAAGPYDVTYTYTDGNLCTADDGAVVTVNALPVVSIAPYAPVCLEDGIFLLTQGTPEGGSYSGTGVIDNLNGTYSFDPSMVVTGNSSTVTYTYTDGNICVNSTTTDISVITCVVKCDTVYGYKSDSQCFIPKFSNWGWTTQITAAETSYTFNLYGGNGNDCDPTDGPGTLYGTATVTYTAGGKVTIFYSMIGSNILNEAHVYIGCNPYPKTKKGAETVAPGSYNFNPTLGGGVKTYTVEVNGVSGPIYIIVHGVACSSGIIAGADGGTKVYSASIACTTPTVATTSIKTQTKVSNVVVSPNPFVKEAKVSYSFDYNTKVKIDVVDMTGNVIKSYNNISYKVGTKGETNLSLSNSLDKMLFVRVSTERETVVKQLVSFNGPEK